MKKLVKATALVALLATLTACTGTRGHDGNGKVCLNNAWMGISIIELVSSCKK